MCLNILYYIIYFVCLKNKTNKSQVSGTWILFNFFHSHWNLDFVGTYKYIHREFQDDESQVSGPAHSHCS